MQSPIPTDVSLMRTPVDGLKRWENLEKKKENQPWMRKDLAHWAGVDCLIYRAGRIAHGWMEGKVLRNNMTEAKKPKLGCCVFVLSLLQEHGL